MINRYLAGDEDSSDDESSSDENGNDDDDGDNEKKCGYENDSAYQDKVSQMKIKCAERLLNLTPGTRLHNPTFSNQRCKPEVSTTSLQNETRQDLFTCTYPGCKKMYKTKRGYEKHFQLIHQQ